MSEGIIDLHTHSRYSDGSMTPTELVNHAKASGIAAIALSDHDSVGGVREAMAAGERVGVEVIPAIELSVISSIRILRPLRWQWKKSLPPAGIVRKKPVVF